MKCYLITYKQTESVSVHGFPIDTSISALSSAIHVLATPAVTHFKSAKKCKYMNSVRSDSITHNIYFRQTFVCHAIVYELVHILLTLWYAADILENLIYILVSG